MPQFKREIVKELVRYYGFSSNYVRKCLAETGDLSPMAKILQESHKRLTDNWDLITDNHENFVKNILQYQNNNLK